jgi:hypothetical protein
MIGPPAPRNKIGLGMSLPPKFMLEAYFICGNSRLLSSAKNSTQDSGMDQSPRRISRFLLWDWYFTVWLRKAGHEM